MLCFMSKLFGGNVEPHLMVLKESYVVLESEHACFGTTFSWNIIWKVLSINTHRWGFCFPFARPQSPMVSVHPCTSPLPNSCQETSTEGATCSFIDASTSSHTNNWPPALWYSFILRVHLQIPKHQSCLSNQENKVANRQCQVGTRTDDPSEVHIDKKAPEHGTEKGLASYSKYIYIFSSFKPLSQIHKQSHMYYQYTICTLELLKSANILWQYSVNILAPPRAEGAFSSGRRATSFLRLCPPSLGSPLSFGN